MAEQNPFQAFLNHDDHLLGMILSGNRLRMRQVATAFRDMRCKFNVHVKARQTVAELLAKQRFANVRSLDFNLPAYSFREVALQLGRFDEFQAALPHFESLTRLDLAHSVSSMHVSAEQMEWLATTLPQCSSLTDLNLSHNVIGECAMSLVPAFPQCSSLTRLDLTDNFITSEGVELLAVVLPRCRSLTHLLLGLNDRAWSGHAVTLLAEALPLCPSLVHLDLSRNIIGDDGIVLLAEGLRRCTSLVHLDLSSIHLNPFHAEGFAFLARVLPDMPRLTHLELGDNRIQADGMLTLAPFLPACPALVHLGLRGNRIGDFGARHLARVLPQCTSLTRLDISVIGLRALGWQSITQALALSRSLAHIELASNRLNETAMRWLAEALGQCRSLTYLGLDDNGITDACMRVMQEHLHRCRSLTELSLRGNQIGEDGAMTLSWVLLHCRRLTRLHLDENPLRPAGARHLANMLAIGCVPSLSRLSLARTSIGDEGVRQLVQCFQGAHTSLAHLDLSYNDIGFAGVTVLQNACTGLTSLVSLELDGNHINGLAIPLLAAFLPELKSLTHITLTHNGIDTDGAQLLRNVLPQCASLVCLDLRSNDIGAEGVRAVTEMLMDPWRARLYRDGSEAQKRNLEQARAYLENSHAILQIMEDIADRLASSWTTHALLATVIKDAHDQLGLLLSGRRTQEDIDLAWLTLSVGKITSEMFRHDLSSSSTHPEAKELNRHVRTLLSNATQVERLMQRLVATEPPAATNPFFVVINPGSGGEGWPRTRPSTQEDFLQFAVTEDYRNRVQDFLARALVEPSPEPAAQGGRPRFNAVTRGRQRAPVSRQGRSRSRQGRSRSNSTSGRSTSPSGLVFDISYEELQAIVDMTFERNYLSSRPDGE